VSAPQQPQDQTQNDRQRLAALLGFVAGRAQQLPQSAQSAQPKDSPEHRIWLWTLVPVAFVALRILVVSRGDSDTLRALVQNLNVPAIFLATILPFVSVGIVLFFAFVLVAASEQWLKREQLAQQGKPLEWLKNLLVGLVLVLPFAGVLGWYAMPMKYVIIAGIMIGILVVVFVGSWLTGNFTRAFNVFGGFYVLCLTAASFVILLSQVGVWLPRERLTVNGSSTGIVYVLSSDDQWTKYLDEAHEVHIVPTKGVTHREPVTDQREWRNLTPSEVLSEKRHQ
jgi:hypothetical protein